MENGLNSYFNHKKIRFKLSIFHFPFSILLVANTFEFDFDSADFGVDL